MTLRLLEKEASLPKSNQGPSSPREELQVGPKKNVILFEKQVFLTRGGATAKDTAASCTSHTAWIFFLRVRQVALTSGGATARDKAARLKLYLICTIAGTDQSCVKNEEKHN